MAAPVNGLIEQALPIAEQFGLNTLKASNLAGLLVDTSGNATLPGTLIVTGATTLTGGIGTGSAITAPIITGGLTASGSAANDFSASTGTFKTSTGAATFGGSSNAFTIAPTGPQIRVTNNSAGTGATVVLAVADSGKVLINASTGGSPSWTLPANAPSGTYFTFVCGNTTTGFTVTSASQVIHFKTSASGTVLTSTTTLTNTQATAIVGDTISIVSDGTAWWMTAISGIFAAS